MKLNDEMHQVEKKIGEGGFVIMCIIGAILLISTIIGFLKPGNKSDDELVGIDVEGNARKERERDAQTVRERELQQKEVEIQQAKEVGRNQYWQLRKDIEVMPEYEHWKKKFLRNLAENVPYVVLLKI